MNDFDIVHSSSILFSYFPNGGECITMMIGGVGGGGGGGVPNANADNYR